MAIRCFFTLASGLILMRSCQVFSETVINKLLFLIARLKVSFSTRVAKKWLFSGKRKATKSCITVAIFWFFGAIAAGM